MKRLTTVFLAAATVAACAFAGTANAKIPKPYKNCTQLNTIYPHGVGRVGAHDIVKGSSEPVTNFTRSNKIYAKAIGYNKGLDRDKDGVACEKH